MDKTVAIAFIILAAAIFCAAIGQIMMKKSIDSLNGKYGVVEILNPLKFLSILREAPMLLLALTIYAVGFMVWIAALSRLELSTMYPFAAGLGYILVAIFSFVFLKEQFTVYKVAGTVMIFIGTFLLLKSA